MSQATVSFPLSNTIAAPRLSLPAWSRKAGIAALEIVAAAAVLLGIWAIAAALAGKDLPGPAQSLTTFWDLISNPFYDKGPNDKGIGLQLLSSLGRVFTGFGLAIAVAIPMGILMGAWAPARGALNPMVQILRPVSPLAWFPIGLAAFHAAPTATVFVIFITSLWPTVINTAFGVASIPKDHQQVAKVFGFSRWKYIRKVILPYSLPHILTGARLSMGIAWMVIVAAEMLAGGMGVGFFVWDSWNSLKVDRILSAILLIGIVGLVLDRVLDVLARRTAYAD